MLKEVKQAGFTILEVLFALVIFASVLFFLTQGLSVGWRAIAASESERRALQLARAELARAGLETPLAEGVHSGEAPNDISYNIIVKPYAPEEKTGNNQLSKAFWVTVVVTWRERISPKRRSLQLTTLKLEGPQ